MTEEKKKPAASKPAPKADVSGEARSAKTEAKPAKAAAPKAAPAAKKAAPKEKAAYTGKTIKIVQTGSPIGREASQRATLIGLGLNKRHRERVVQDTPETRGMLRKVQHLVKVIG